MGQLGEGRIGSKDARSAPFGAARNSFELPANSPILMSLVERLLRLGKGPDPSAAVDQFRSRSPSEEDIVRE